MEKIQKWVVNNIADTTDEEQYGYDELWVPPVMEFDILPPIYMAVSG
jgi:predicted transglutaminase-like cysteine proteinase